MLMHADGLGRMQQTLSVWSLSVFNNSTSLQSLSILGVLAFPLAVCW